MSAHTIKKPTSFRNRPGADLGASLLGIALGFASTGAIAADDGKEAQEKTFSALETIEVYGERGALYKARRSGDDRHFEDLADSPQTMTILTQTQLRDSGNTDLKEILASQAGITLGTGENGNAFGDRYVIRGHEARSDVFVDGVRDPGMTTRESFATEQIEITKGPSSTFAGRGSTGGAVNSITKQASDEQSFSILDSGFGSDDYYRFTYDGNLVVNESFAVRANVLTSQEDVPDRAPADRERNGVLLSGAYKLSDDTSFVVDGYYLDAKDKPDLGSFFDRTTREPIEDIPVYVQDSDFLDTKVNSFTVRLKHSFSESLSMQNSMRYGTTDNGYVTTGIGGTTRDVTDPDAPGAATYSLSGHQGWQEVDYFVNQLNLFWETPIAGLANQIAFGLEYSQEDVRNGTYSLNNTGATNCILPGRRGGPAGAGHCVLDASGAEVANLNNLLGREITKNSFDSNFQVNTISAYAMDTVELSDAWTGFFGLRYDQFDYENTVRQRGGAGFDDYDYDDGFWNGHAGLVYKIAENGNVYATYSTATNINGGESDVGGSCGYGGLCGTPQQVKDSDPEQTENLELGTKWSLSDGRLLLSAAVFRITKEDVMESVGNAYSTLGTLNTGKNRVEGFELSLVGNVTDKLSVQASAAFMESEILNAFNTTNEGLALSNFADDSLYLQVRYQATPKFAFGAIYTYQSEMFGGQPDTAAGFDANINDYSIVVPSFDKYDMFLSYDISDKLSMRLNVNNVTDEEYWLAAYRSGTFMYLGDARSYRATLSWDI